MRRHWKRRAAAAVMAATVAVSAVTVVGGSTAGAKYDFKILPKPGTEQDAIDKFLYEKLDGALDSAVDGGIKAVGTHILTPIAQSFLNTYIPGLGDLLFGGSSSGGGYQQQFAELSTKIDDLHLDLANKHEDLLHEIMLQFDVDIKARLDAASDSLVSFNAQPDLIGRWNELDRVCVAEGNLNDARREIERYIKEGAGGGEAKTQMRRLHLLPAHTTLAQMVIQTNAQCSGLKAIRSEYMRTGEPAGKTFFEWLNALSRADLASMDAATDATRATARNVHRQVLDFYQFVTSSNFVDAYLDDVWTPTVFQNGEFKGGAGNYSNPAVITDSGSWTEVEDRFGVKPAGSGIGILDALRWYYYVDIPNGECLQRKATDDLTVRDIFPFKEKHPNAAASDCNRFWITADPNNATPVPRYLASFDRYTLWFEDPEAHIDRHRELIKGDILLQIYGPTSLIIDKVHAELNNGQTRPRNDWDRALEKRDYLTSLLDVADGWGDDKTVEMALQYEEELRDCGITIESVGLAVWHSLLRQSVQQNSSASACRQANVDSDLDGLTDVRELFETKTHPHNADFDGDGLFDGDEVDRGTNPANADTDGDGLTDSEEVSLGTDPLKVDTDGDGLTDSEEVSTGTDPLKADSDGDNLDDDRELELRTNALVADTDGDGLADGIELAHLTSPLLADTDGDSLSDGDEVTRGTNPANADTDGDALSDGDEIAAGTDPRNGDSDADGLSDGDEIARGTNPAKADTDDDGLLDRDEIARATDPLKGDTDGDGLTDGDEIEHGTDPLKADTDGDGVSDGDEIELGDNPRNLADNTCTVTGTDGPDLFFGTFGNDVFCGLGGDDLVISGFGNDRFQGGDGDDTMIDLIGTNVFIGGNGDDAVVFGRANDRIIGGDGRDLFLPGFGVDRIIDYTEGTDIVVADFRALDLIPEGRAALRNCATNPVGCSSQVIDWWRATRQPAP